MTKYVTAWRLQSHKRAHDDVINRLHGEYRRNKCNFGDIIDLSSSDG